MTVEDLIEELQKIEDKDRRVMICVGEECMKNFQVVDKYGEITLE